MKGRESVTVALPLVASVLPPAAACRARAATMHGTIHVGLMSGRSVQIEVSMESLLEDVREQASHSLQTSPGVLLDHGEHLNMSHTVGEAGLSFGCALTMQVQRTAVAGYFSAFAAILGDGSVVSWGMFGHGDNSTVKEKLKNVQQIQATAHTFSAILSDGSVVAWGDAGCDEVQEQLKHVRCIQATSYAFAAILVDGSVVTWGDLALGGESSRV